MKIKLLLSVLVCLATLQGSFSSTSLRVLDPQNWGSTRGKIDEVTISVKPKGAYMEYGLYLTFSAKNTYLYNRDAQLEVDMYFDLPKEAIIHDSWLWVEDSIMKAIIIDKWTASTIYEGFVNRRKDPSILTKLHDGSFRLKVYPLPSKGSRKVKISYLLPVEWSANKVSTPLPINIIKTSHSLPGKIDIITYPDKHWQNPEIVGFPEMKFAGTSPARLSILKEDLSKINSAGLGFTSPLRNGIYVNQYATGVDEGYYQMAFVPSKVLDLSDQKNVAVLVDYDASKTDATKQEIFANIKNMLHTNLTDRDSFNILLSNLNFFRISNNWLRADSLTIEKTFDNLSGDKLSTYSNLTGLLVDGINFVKYRNQSKKGSIMLVSSSDQLGNSESANQLIQDIKTLMEPEQIPIHVTDFQSKNFSYNKVGGKTYRGNEYFYTNISRVTGGNMFRLQNNYNISFRELLLQCGQSLWGNINSFDLHTTLDNGFCFARYNVTSQGSAIFPTTPVVQIGRYKGDFSFKMQASGIYQTEIFTKSIMVDPADVESGDSMTRRAWVGNYIRQLESESNKDNRTINEIIDSSITNRVLSTFTAFLALEPNDSISPCRDECEDETGTVISVKEDIAKNDSLSLEAMPNPFTHSTKLKVTIPKDISSDGLSLQVYNIMGQTVKTFNADPVAEEGNLEINWDGTDDSGSRLSPGTYLFVVTTSKQRKVHRLVLMN